MKKQPKFCKTLFGLLSAAVLTILMLSVMLPNTVLAAAPGPSEVIYKEDTTPEAPSDTQSYNNMKFCELTKNEGATIMYMPGVPDIPFLIMTNNTRDNYTVEYTLDLSNLGAARSKEDLQAQVAFNVRNYWRSTVLFEDDIAVFNLLYETASGGRELLACIDGDTDTRIKGNGIYSDIETDWVGIPASAVKLVLKFTTRRGETNDNKAFFQSIRLYINDSTGPKALNVCTPPGWPAGYSYYYREGQQIDFEVQFDEPVLIDGDLKDIHMSAPKISDPNDRVNFIATCLGVSPTNSQRIKYTLTVPADVEVYNLHIHEEELSTSGAFSNVKDSAGNSYFGALISNGGFNHSFLKRIKLDSVVPSLEKVEITRAKPQKTYLGTGDTLYFDLYFSEELDIGSYLSSFRLELNNGAELTGDGAWPDPDNKKRMRLTYVIQAGQDNSRIDVKTIQQPDGTWNLSLYSFTVKDFAGNEANPVKAPVIGSSGYVCSQQIMVDTTPPVINSTSETGWKKMHTLTPTVSDPAGSGVLDYTFRFTFNEPFTARILPTADPGNPPFEEINSGPAELPHTLEIQTPHSGSYTLVLKAADQAGNTNTILKSLNFDNTPPAASISKISSDSVRISASDSAAGFKPQDIRYQWAAYDDSTDTWVTSESSWQYETGTDVYVYPASYTSNTITMPTIDGQVNYGKLIAEIQDILGNSTRTEGPAIYIDKRDAYFELNFPDNASEIRPSFDISITPSSAPATDVYVQWAEKGASSTDTGYKLLGNLPSASLGSIAVQKEFNQNQPFHGMWTLHARAKRSDGTGDWIYLEQPISFKFDNSAPTVDITPIPNIQMSEAPSAEVSVADAVYSSITGLTTEYPIILDDPDSKCWVKDPSGMEVFSTSSLPGMNFTANFTDLESYGTGRYILTVTAKGYDGIAPALGKSNYAMEYIYLDVNSPGDGQVLNMPRSIKSTAFSGVKFSCTDVTTLFDSMYFNYAVDGIWAYDSEDKSTWPQYSSKTGLEVDASACRYKYEYKSGSVTLDIPDMEGSHTLSWMFADGSGNTSTEYTQEFILDKTPPVGGLTFDCMTPTNQNTAARVGWVSDVYSAYDNIEAYQQSTSTWVTLEQWSKTVNQNGIYTCTIRDEAGNEAAITGVIDWIDKKIPAISPTVYEADKVIYKFAKFDVTAWDVDKLGGKAPVKLYYSFDSFSTDQSWHEMVECNTPSLKATRTETAEGLDVWTVYCAFPYSSNRGSSSTGNPRWINLKAVDSTGNERETEVVWPNYMNITAKTSILYYSPQKAYGTTAGPVKAGVSFKQNVVAALGESVNIPATFDEFPDDSFNNSGSGFDFYIYRNGSYDLTYQDRFGNTHTLYDYIVVDWIDESILPEVTMDPSGKTNGSVTVTLDTTNRNGVYLYNVSPPEGSSITSTEGGTSLTINSTTVQGYKKVTCLVGNNGKLNYSVYNTENSKKADTYITVDSIDTQVPSGTIVYAPDGIIKPDGTTRGNMIATVVNMEDDSGASNISFANSEGSTHTFTENGSYDFILEDEAGNRTVLTATVDNIDRSPLPSDITAPGCELRYFVNMPGGSIDISNSDGTFNVTNRDVHVIIVPVDESSVTAATVDNPTGTVTCSDDTFEYIFTEDASLKVRLTDSSGNSTDVEIIINNIDKVPPSGSVTYSKDESTQNVTAVLDASDDRTVQLRYLNTSGLDYTAESKPCHLFTENGAYTFIVADEAGNTSYFPVSVRWIDRDKPTFSINPSDPSALAKTNKDVKVFITPSEPYSSVDFIDASNNVTVKPDDVELVLGIDNIKLTFTKNTSLTLRVYDNNGNYDNIAITVNCIDKVLPTAAADIAYNQPSKGYATITLTGQSETVSIENNGGSPQMIVKQNGKYQFVICDTAGNRATITAEVTGIDNDPPILSLQYIPEEWTKGPVTVSLTANEDIVVNDKGAKYNVNLGDSYDIIMEKNGAYTLFASDMSGNTSSITAAVDKIDSSAPVLSFSGPLKPVFLENGTYDLNDCTAEDNIDGTIDPSAITIIYNGFDISKPGSYTVEYKVSDNVGNETVVQRQATVLLKNDFRVYINNMDTLGGSVMCDTSTITLELFNVEGAVSCKWKKGSLTEGEMKNGANTVDGITFTVSSTGWYTLLVRNQERKTYLIHFYVTRIDD